MMTMPQKRQTSWRSLSHLSRKFQHNQQRGYGKAYFSGSYNFVQNLF